MKFPHTVILAKPASVGQLLTHPITLINQGTGARAFFRSQRRTELLATGRQKPSFLENSSTN